MRHHVLDIIDSPKRDRENVIRFMFIEMDFNGQKKKKTDTKR